MDGSKPTIPVQTPDHLLLKLPVRPCSFVLDCMHVREHAHESFITGR